MKIFAAVALLCFAFVSCGPTPACSNSTCLDDAGTTSGGGTASTGGGSAAGGGTTSTGGGTTSTGGGSSATGGGTAATGGGTAATGGGSGTNAEPVVGTINAPTAVYAGKIANISITATDPDGDTLTYSWSTPGSVAGTFGNASAASTTWFSAEGATTQTVNLQVIVNDGHNHPVTVNQNISVTVPTWTDVYTDIVSVKCLGCHGVGAGTMVLGTTKATAYAAIFNVNHGRGATCSNNAVTRRVSPGDKVASAFYRKPAGTQPTGCGNAMPNGTGPLPANEIVSIGTWITGGAIDN